MVLAPKVYEWASALFALGAALRLAPLLERHAATLRRRLLVSFPALVALLVALAGWVIGGQSWADWREAARPMPPDRAPNVLLITLDTVRADHLSLHGYGRPTSPVLDTIAKAGIRFDEARAAAPWTVPSHATMFTGRWPHELGVRWQAPLGRAVPTLAEHLGSRGYATAGFVANAGYCSYDSGLDRGFTHYEDYALRHLLPFRTAWLVDRTVRLLGDLGWFVGRTFDVGPLRPLQESWLSTCLADFMMMRGAGSGPSPTRSLGRPQDAGLVARLRPRPGDLVGGIDAQQVHSLPRDGEDRISAPLQPPVRRRVDPSVALEHIIGMRCRVQLRHLDVRREQSPVAEDQDIQKADREFQLQRPLLRSPAHPGEELRAQRIPVVGLLETKAFRPGQSSDSDAVVREVIRICPDDAQEALAEGQGGEAEPGPGELE
jgi:hypothetical protein